MTDDALPAVPSFPVEDKVCGNCRLWSAHTFDPVKGWVGPCRVQPSRGNFPPTAPICNVFASKHLAAVPISAPNSVRRAVRTVAPVVRRKGESAPTISIASPTAGDTAEVLDMTKDELMQVFLDASGMSDVTLAPKWEGGSIQIVPGNKELQGKEIPIDGLLHKVVMVRDRLRTLEQKINAHPKLSDAEKVDMQQYITRCYGSLTTFNVLFKDKGDQFVGQKGDEGS